MRRKDLRGRSALAEGYLLREMRGIQERHKGGKCAAAKWESIESMRVRSPRVDSTGCRLLLLR